MSLSSFWQYLADWYEGEYVPYENDPLSGIFIVGGDYKRHWTARAVRKAVDFWSAHWQWTIGTCIAVLGLYIAAVKS